MIDKLPGSICAIDLRLMITVLSQLSIMLKWSFKSLQHLILVVFQLPKLKAQRHICIDCLTLLEKYFSFIKQCMAQNLGRTCTACNTPQGEVKQAVSAWSVLDNKNESLTLPTQLSHDICFEFYWFGHFKVLCYYRYKQPCYHLIIHIIFLF